MLPKPDFDSPVRLDEAQRNRRTLRAFSGAALPLAALSRLLWAGQGMSGEDGKRIVPSAHALYPLRLFVAAGRIEDLVPGLYAYDPKGSDLARLSDRDLRAGLCAAALEDQPWIAEAAAVVIIGADMERALDAFKTQPPDGRRGRRYVWIETGALAQNVALAATALGLGSVFIGGFDDDATAAVLGLPAPYRPAGLLCIGHPAVG